MFDDRSVNLSVVEVLINFQVQHCGLFSGGRCASGPPRPRHVTDRQRYSPSRRRTTSARARDSSWTLKTVAGSLRVSIILETGHLPIMSSGEFGDQRPGIGLPLTTSTDKVQFVIINHVRCS